ncbi:MAG TPA: UPF0104 family protein [Citreicella sp.]|jgi:uncharacterized membrane protein YbhN (UPF0104 family)|nr:UPF0104 family protein [Citreicella sp.]
MSRATLIRLAQAAMACALLVLLWRVADGAQALDLLRGADPLWLGAALLALAAQTVLSALRWRLTAARLGLQMGTGRAVAEYYLAQLVNQALPGGVLGDAGRALRARGSAGLLVSGQAVVIERLAGQAALLAALALGLALGGRMLPPALLLPVLMVLGIAALLPLALWAARALPGAPGRAARGFAGACARALLGRDTLPRQLGLSLGTVACNLAAFAFCARATGTPLPLAAILALVPLILLTMVLPLTIGGWGLREGAAAALFPLAGASAAAGLATSIAFGLMLLVSVLPGLVALWPVPRARADPRP